jgi:hypothetical protein
VGEAKGKRRAVQAAQYFGYRGARQGRFFGMQLELTFQGEGSYARWLGNLRKVKKYVSGLQIRKRHAGACVSGSREKITLVHLVLPGNSNLEWPLLDRALEGA